MYMAAVTVSLERQASAAMLVLHPHLGGLPDSLTARVIYTSSARSTCTSAPVVWTVLRPGCRSFEAGCGMLWFKHAHLQTSGPVPPTLSLRRDLGLPHLPRPCFLWLPCRCALNQALHPCRRGSGGAARAAACAARQGGAAAVGPPHPGHGHPEPHAGQLQRWRAGAACPRRSLASCRGSCAWQPATVSRAGAAVCAPAALSCHIPDRCAADVKACVCPYLSYHIAVMPAARASGMQPASQAPDGWHKPWSWFLTRGHDQCNC